MNAQSTYESVPKRLKNGYEFVPLTFEDNFPFGMHQDTLLVDFPAVLSHFHREIEILYVVDGEANICFNQIKNHVRAGDAMFIGPYATHAIETIQSRKCTYYTIIFNLDMIPEMLKHLIYPFHLLCSEPKIIDMLRLIVDEQLNKPEYYKETIRSRLSILFAELLRRYDLINIGTENIAKSFKKVRPVIKYLHENFLEKVQISDLCTLFHMSESSLGSHFSKATGKSVTEYLNILRCQNAYSLICSGKYTVTEAAFLSGFQNLSYFTRRFRECYGITPSQIKPKH